jgi:hypothetical protein
MARLGKSAVQLMTDGPGPVAGRPAIGNRLAGANGACRPPFDHQVPTIFSAKHETG